ncbi:hypothetical protein cyc_09242, partial [Cyclospora cayetanensis]
MCVSNLCAVTVQPELLSPLLPCAIAWQTLRLSNPLLAPTRLQLRSTLCVPSPSTLCERMLGVSPEASACIRMRHGFVKAPEPEGFALSLRAEPILLTLDTLSVILVYQLLAISGALAEAVSTLFPSPGRTQQDDSRG